MPDKEYYSPPSTPPSHPLYGGLEAEIVATMQSSSKDHRTIRKKVGEPCSLFPFCFALMLDQALARDGFRCMITGLIDRTSYEHYAELKHQHSDGYVTVKTCHILNELVVQGIDKDKITTRDKVCTVVRVLHCLFLLPITPDILCHWGCGHPVAVWT